MTRSDLVTSSTPYPISVDRAVHEIDDHSASWHDYCTDTGRDPDDDRPVDARHLLQWLGY